MRIDVAGAGAGKTTGLAKEIIQKHDSIEDTKNIYCLAFTNNAVESIRSKLLHHYKTLPRNIIVCTIHSFLYQEFISPYYYLLFGRYFKTISNIPLPSNPLYRNKKIMDLESKDIIHVQSIPEKAKWVIVKRSSDRKHERDIRAVIHKTFLTYCEAIFIDEAQDIDSDMKEIIVKLDSLGCNLILKGDPKQDLRGYGCFRELINSYENDITYIAVCHRCPENHIQLTNSFVSKKEQQKTKKQKGTIAIKYESDIPVSDIVKVEYDLKYILKKNDRIETHLEIHDNSNSFESLYYEVYNAVNLSETDKMASKIKAYNYTSAMIKLYRMGMQTKEIMQKLSSHVGSMSKQRYASICSALNNSMKITVNTPYVNSIESIKGAEGNNCLFIITLDLAAYLFGDKKDENKTKNALYVALTRSLHSLTLYITSEVETQYGRATINCRLAQYV